MISACFLFAHEQSTSQTINKLITRSFHVSRSCKRLTSGADLNWIGNLSALPAPRKSPSTPLYSKTPSSLSVFGESLNTNQCTCFTYSSRRRMYFSLQDNRTVINQIEFKAKREMIKCVLTDLIHVHASLGCFDFILEHVALGWVECRSDGFTLGTALGWVDCALNGVTLGVALGWMDGASDGLRLGVAFGWTEGTSDGVTLDTALGWLDGASDGVTLGVALGWVADEIRWPLNGNQLVILATIQTGWG